MSELIKISLGSLALVANGLPVQGQAGVPTATATVVGSGAVSATVVVRGSNDGVAWVPLATLSPSGTGTGVASGTWSGDYAQLRADVTAISAGSVVSTMVSVDQTGSAAQAIVSAASKPRGLRGLKASMGRQICVWPSLTAVNGDVTLVDYAFPVPDGATKSVRLGYSAVAGGSNAHAPVAFSAYTPATGTFPALGVWIYNPTSRALDFRLRLWNEAFNRSIVYGGSAAPGEGFYTLSSLATVLTTWTFPTDKIAAVRVEQPTGGTLLPNSSGEWSPGEYLVFGPTYADIKGRAAVLITFDDVPDTLTEPYPQSASVPPSGRSALEMLTYFGLKGNVFLSSKVFGKGGAKPEHIRKVQDAGWTVGSHTRSHPVNAAGDGLRLLGPMGWNYSRAAGNGRNDCRVISTGASTDTLTCEGNHSLSVGSKIEFTTGAPTGLAVGVTYWPFATSGATMKLATTEANANAGIAIDLPSDWTGTVEFRFAGSAPDISAIRADIRGGIDDITAAGITGHERYFALPQGGWDRYVREACEAEGVKVVRGTASPAVTHRPLYVGPGVSCRPTGGTASGSPNCPPGWPHIAHSVSVDGGAWSLAQALAFNTALCDNGWVGSLYHHSTADNAAELHAYLADVAAKRDGGLLEVPTLQELDEDLGCW